MKNKVSKTIFALVLSMFSAHGAVITGVTATATTEGGSRPAVDVVDGSGLTGNQHGTYPHTWMWLSGTNTVPQAIVFDLGSVYNVTQLHVWNYNEAGEWSDLGAKNVSVTFGTTLSGFTLGGATGTVASITTFARAPGLDTYTGQYFSTSFDARYVKFDISSNYSSTYNYIGLSEVQFTGTAVPEPNAALLGGLGVLALLRRRR